MDTAVHCDYLCNRWGIETISAGGMSALAKECYGNGILTKDDILPEIVRSVSESGIYKGGEKCVISDYGALLDEYYAACGWAIETSVPNSSLIVVNCRNLD
jgi:aldehyde:ferredoxin oxidoreductase